MNIVLDNKIRIATNDLSEELKGYLEDRLIFTNPKWIENRKHGYWNGETSKSLEFIYDEYGHKVVPRGFLTQLEKLCGEITIDDRTRKLGTIDVEFKGKLHPFQKQAVQEVFYDRKKHCELLYKILEKHTEARLLTGDIAITKRKAVLEDLKNGKTKVLVATSQLIGEGFDLPELSTLFFATPVKFTGKVKQCAGRILRTAKGKDGAVI